MTIQEEMELNGRLARQIWPEAVVFKWNEPQFPMIVQGRFHVPDKRDCLYAGERFTRSLDACFHPEWGIVRKGHICGVQFRFYPGPLHCVITVRDEGGFTEYEGKVPNEPPYEEYNIEKAALALCLAVDKMPREEL